MGCSHCFVVYMHVCIQQSLDVNKERGENYRTGGQITKESVCKAACRCNEIILTFNHTLFTFSLPVDYC